MSQNLSQGRELPEVHIRCRIGHVTQCRHLECPQGVLVSRVGEYKLGTIVFRGIAVLAEAVEFTRQRLAHTAIPPHVRFRFVHEQMNEG